MTLRKDVKENMIIEDIEALFVKICTNELPAIDVLYFKKTGQKRPMVYRREDLTQWAKEAFDRGETTFHAQAVPNGRANGPMELAEPAYQYALIRNLTPEEYNFLFQKGDKTNG